MSQVIGILLFVVIVTAFLSKVAMEIRDILNRRRVMAVERIAVEEYRANRPIDRVAIIQELVGAIERPRMARTLPADEVKAIATRQRIGTVRMAMASPCDEVVWSPFFTHRDLGDETPVTR